MTETFYGTDKRPIQANKNSQFEITTRNGTYLRLPIKTRLITVDDKLDDLLREYVTPLLRPGDLIFISEKIVALVQGNIVRIADIKPTKLARILAGKVKNGYGTKDFVGFGHGTPMAMQLLLDHVGVVRILFAAGVSAITRPLGIKGLFYFICGRKAKSVDCPMSFILQPYTHYAKLPLLNGMEVAVKTKQTFGYETVIIDANYRGVFSLGRSSRQIKERFIKELFRVNPLGQSDEMTPFCIVRKKS